MSIRLFATLAVAGLACACASQPSSPPSGKMENAVEARATVTAVDPATLAGKTNLQWIGETLFSKYILPFEIAAVILTVALVVAVMLTLRRRPGTKHQDPARQVAVRRDDRVRLVKMPAETRQEGNP